VRNFVEFRFWSLRRPRLTIFIFRQGAGFTWNPPADSLTADLLVSSVITSVIMAAVGVLACAAPARRALRVQPTEALRQV
jgi:ABC-type lipoprotein release transport system permease subunit